MSPRPEEGLDNETNFFIQGENEKEELTDYKEDNSKVEGEQILDAIGSTIMFYTVWHCQQIQILSSLGKVSNSAMPSYFGHYLASHIISPSQHGLLQSGDRLLV